MQEHKKHQKGWGESWDRSRYERHSRKGLQCQSIQNNYQNVLKNQYKGDFKVEVVVNNTLATVIADTGAKVSVCSLEQAKKWKLTGKTFSTNTKLKPFNSDPIKVERQAICAVIFGSNSVPVKWQIIAAECEPILAGNPARVLGIIEFNCKLGIITHINMIHTDPKGEIQSCLAKYSHNF